MTGTNGRLNHLEAELEKQQAARMPDPAKLAEMWALFCDVVTDCVRAGAFTMRPDLAGEPTPDGKERQWVYRYCPILVNPWEAPDREALGLVRMALMEILYPYNVPRTSWELDPAKPTTAEQLPDYLRGLEPPPWNDIFSWLHCLQAMAEIYED